ncbi:MAG TPA: hypothetical protein VGQ26_28765 [Streptosporangiaceae bacterium]|jgi:hypothetical protein|nr:hypothetical protein [Streptosporangiaceae bacterium]
MRETAVPLSNVCSSLGVMALEPPYCPPVVGMASGPIGHLLSWERHERDGS